MAETFSQTKSWSNRMSRLAWIFACVSLGTASAPAIGAKLAPQPIPPDLVEAVQAASRIGQMLYTFDKAASDATDAVQRLGPGHPDPRVRGWLVNRDNGAATTTFFGEEGPG